MEPKLVEPESVEPKLVEPESVEPASVESESVQLEIVPAGQDRGMELRMAIEVPPRPTTPLPGVREIANSEPLNEDAIKMEEQIELQLPPLPSTPLPDEEQSLSEEDKSLPAEDRFLSDEDQPLSDQPGGVPPMTQERAAELEVTNMALLEASPPPPDIPEEDLANGYKSEGETESVEQEAQLELPPHPSTPPPEELSEIPPPPTSPLPDEDQLPQITKKGRLTKERVIEINLEMVAQHEEVPFVPSTPPPPEDQPNGEAQLESSSEEMEQRPIPTYLPPEDTVFEPQQAHTHYSCPSVASIVSLEGSLKFTNSEEFLGPPQHV